MVVRLVRGEEVAEISADDQLLHDSLCYAGIFERKVKEVVQAFYRQAPENVQP